MPGQVLGGAVDDQVDAQFQRPLVERGGEGAVDQCPHPSAPPDLGQHRQIEAAQKGIGGRLGDDEAGVGVDAGLDGGQIAGRHRGAVDAKAMQHTVGEGAGAVVAVGGDDEMVAGRKQDQ